MHRPRLQKTMLSVHLCLQGSRLRESCPCGSDSASAIPYQQKPINFPKAISEASHSEEEGKETAADDS